MKVRLDKYLGNLWLVSRRTVGQFIKNKSILVNWEIAKKSDIKLQKWDQIELNWQPIEVREFVYVMLNKPDGYLSTNIDEYGHETFKKLLDDCPYVELLNAAGRLDVDTEWLLFCTNDGTLNHKITSPRSSKTKTYYVQIESQISDQDIESLENWVTFEDWYHTLPAKVEKISDTEIYLTIVEWKYHQVKKMLRCVDNRVIYLRRDKIGKLELWELWLWKWKYLDEQDLKLLWLD